MTGWLFDAFVDVNLLILLVLLVRQPVARFGGARWAYALWLLPALKLIVPPLSFLEDSASIPSATILIGGVGSAAPLPALAGPGQWVPFMLALWAGGAVVFLGWQAIVYQAFLRRASRHSHPADPALFDDIQVSISDAVNGPVAVGLLHRRIFLPVDFADRYDAMEQDFALTHESIHHRRGDLWWNVVALALLAANWFNPLAYLAFRSFRADQELACDAAVVDGANPAERHHYAQALVKSASSPGLIAACPLHPADQLKRRLRMMNSHRNGRLRNLAGWAAIGTVGILALGLSAPIAAQDNVKKEVVREFRIKHIDRDGKHSARDPRHLAEMEGKCDGERGETKIDTGSGDRKTRLFLFLCEDKGTSSAEMRDKMIAALEKARADLGSREEMKPEQRAEITAKIDAEIARLRSQGSAN